MEIQLFVKSKGDGTVRNYQLPAGAPVVIGRNPEALVPLEGSALSRDHFSIEYRDGSVWVTDTSSNGTWINGELVGRGRSKPAGIADMIEVAGYEFNYKVSEPPQAVAASVKSGTTSGITTPVALPRAPAVAGVMDRVSGFVGPFGGAEKMAVVLILSAVALVLIYVYS